MAFVFYDFTFSAAPRHTDILRFYVVHENYENLLESNVLGLLWNYTNEMMFVHTNYEGVDYPFEAFCKKEEGHQVIRHCVTMKITNYVFRIAQTI